MKMTPVISSNIAAISYYEPKQELSVQFKNGKTFSYSDVSPKEHAALMASESVGKHFIQFIKSVKVGSEALVFDEKALLSDKEKINLLREALSDAIERAEYDLPDDIINPWKSALEATNGGE